MFASLSDRLGGVLQKVRGQGRISEDNIKDTLREIRMALLEADVALPVVREFVGHGIGTALHEDPQVPNFGAPGRGPRLKRGMTLAIEPMFAIGGSGVDVQPDGWTVLTRDRGPSAHFEHTVAVAEGGAEILTR